MEPIVVGGIETNVEYVSFDEAHTLPFTNEHQPSLAATTLRAANIKKKIVARQQVPSSRVTSLSTAPNITKLKKKTNFKIGVAAKVRGVVGCNNCKKSRCIYSHAAVSLIKPPLPPNDLNDQRDEAPLTTQKVKPYQAMAKGRLDDAIESTHFLCGMAPSDPDDPLHDIFLCDTSLDCDMHIEASFYVSRIYSALAIEGMLSLCWCV